MSQSCRNGLASHIIHPLPVVEPPCVPMKRREAAFEASMPEAFVQSLRQNCPRRLRGHPPTMDKNNNVLFRLVKSTGSNATSSHQISHRAIHSLIHLFNVLDFEPAATALTDFLTSLPEKVIASPAPFPSVAP